MTADEQNEQDILFPPAVFIFELSHHIIQRHLNCASVYPFYV